MRFKDELREVPKKSGCYLMYNKDNIVIYVGKAKILFNRLHSYFNREHTGKTKKMVSEIDHFEYIVTASETEAFILEINLIKKYDPKYNILLRDDKSYPYIELTDEKYPRLRVKRQINISKKSSHLFGPYPNVYAARRMVNLLNRLYPLRKCDTMPKRVCLYYHINECLGYCEHKDINCDIYLKEILSILNGNNKLLIDKINEKIKINSDSLNYEVCKELVDELGYIKTILNSEIVVELDDNLNRDIVNYYYDNSFISIVIFFIRGGKLVGNHYKIIPIIDEVKETLEYYIVNFYSKRNIVPRELIVPELLDNELLSEIINTKVINVFRGPKKKLFDMAYNNAKTQYEKEIQLIYNNEKLTTDANEELKSLLNMPSLHTIEAFDNSNLFGTYTVSGMVVFKDGKPSKNDYRKFKITMDKNDDYGTMREAIYRRYFRVLKDNLERPDLIIVDGGVRQIHVAREVLQSLSMEIPVVGLKKDNHHATSKLLAFFPLQEIEIDKRSNLFYYLERMQDEVHNFTIHYHKQLRSKGALESILDNVEGIGEKRKKKLLKKYHSTTKLKTLSISELEEVLPHQVAQNLYYFLQEMDEKK